MAGRRRNFECISHREDGSFALAASSLNGNTWDGCVWLFDSWKHFSQSANLDLSANNSVSGISDIAWYDDNRLLLALDSGEVEMWQVMPPGSMLDCKASFSNGHQDMVLCLCVAGNNSVLSGGADGRIGLWDAEHAQLTHTYKGHMHWVTALAGNPSQPNVFVSASLDGTVKHWDTRENKPVVDHLLVEGGSTCSLKWSPSSEHLIAMGGQSGSVVLSDVRAKGSPVLRYHPHTRTVHRLAFPQWNADLLASVSDDTLVKVQRVTNNTNVFTNKVHKDFVHGVDWHPVDSCLLSCGWDGQLLCHNINVGEGEVMDDDSMQRGPPPWSNGDMELETVPAHQADNDAVVV